MGIACLYCDYHDQENQTIVNMIGGLAKQLMWQARSIPQSVWEVFEEKTKARTTINLGVSQELLTLILHEFSLVYICIDALDECGPLARRQLLQYLNSRGSPRVFVTGRQSVEVEVMEALANLSPQIIRIIANKEDIRTCLSQRIAEDTYPEAMDETLKEEIIEKIISLSHGT